MTDDFFVTQVADGTYRVQHGDRGYLVYVAGPPGDRWAFWDGQVFRADMTTPRSGAAASQRRGPRALHAPMPATVVKVLAVPGRTVVKNEILVVLDAMKMELPIRAPEDGIVTAVRCREGELVQADATLVELE
jgi:3-methylcrotonyl-CoA carboxylase alpha subunit